MESTGANVIQSIFIALITGFDWFGVSFQNDVKFLDSETKIVTGLVAADADSDMASAVNPVGSAGDGSASSESTPASVPESAAPVASKPILSEVRYRF
jgi:hypothetical protein